MIDRVWLLAPCYIILAGTSPGEACLFTRSRCGHEHPRTLHEHGAIVQCNTDHWECDPLVDILESAERRSAAAEMVGRLSRARLEPGSALPGLWNFLHTAPIENDITVYATVMVPARGADTIRLRYRSPDLPSPKSICCVTSRVQAGIYGTGTRIGAHNPEVVSGFELE